MADTPLLADGLSMAERVSLGMLAAHPGYAVLDKMIRAAVDRANAKVMLVDPQDANYNRVLAATQQEARATNTFAKLVLRSIAYHTQVGAQQAQTVESKLQQQIQEALKP